MTHEFLDSLIDRYGDAAMVHTATLVASGNQPYSTWEIVLVLPSGNRIVVSGTVDSMGFAVVDKK
jgi:hypothetical protein